VKRTITGFRQDEEGDWIAELSCGHRQHVRHRPPFESRAWVQSEAGRADRIDGSLECPLCARAELPEDLRWVRRSVEWSEHTVPGGLLRSHRLAEGTWGLLGVLSGRLGFRAATDPPIDEVLVAGATQAIPPGVAHEVRLIGPTRFGIDFFALKAGVAGDEGPEGDVPG
jgi:tellurite resistance-related uncharacterized protein